MDHLENSAQDPLEITRYPDDAKRDRVAELLEQLIVCSRRPISHVHSLYTVRSVNKKDEKFVQRYIPVRPQLVDIGEKMNAVAALLPAVHSAIFACLDQGSTLDGNASRGISVEEPLKALEEQAVLAETEIARIEAEDPTWIDADLHLGLSIKMRIVVDHIEWIREALARIPKTPSNAPFHGAVFASPELAEQTV
ncbi:MAG: hypothetical protein Q7R81_03880 [Candidatus Peregrinibacteria bacterium]|nr:hypothetical protein [Candidatus Peregrinibacteria bacterium]